MEGKMEIAEFMRLQTVLKKEKLFAAAERQAIRDLYVELNDLTTQLMSTSRTARRIHWDTHLWQNNKIKWAEYEMRNKALIDDEVEFLDVHMKLRQHAGPYETFVRAIKSNPTELANCIYKYFNQRGSTLSTDSLDDLLRCVLFSVHCNFFLPEEEQAVMTMLDELLRLQVDLSKDRADLYLRGSSAFTRMILLYCREYTPKGPLFLIAALREPVLTVLGDDDLDLEIDPTVIWSILQEKLSEQEKVDMFGPTYKAAPPDTPDKLLAQPSFKAHMEAVHASLVKFCADVVASLTAALHSMPYILRWIARRVTTYLTGKGLGPQEIRSALGNIVLSRFIAPAVSKPDSFGIVIDTPISITARRNLGLISRVLRDINRGAFNAQPAWYLEPLYAKLREVGTGGLNTFLDKLGDIGDNTGLAYPPLAVNHRGRRRVVGLTLAELYTLQDSLGSLELDGSSTFAAVLQRLPGVGDRPEDTDEGTQVVVISLGDDDVIGGLLSESDIIARVQAARRKAAHARGGGGSSGGKGEEAAGEADEAEDAAAGGEAGGAAEAADEGAVVDELCQKLRVSLSTMGFSAQWQHLDLLDVLRAELAEAVALDKNAVQAQLQASLRSLATLPATALGPGGSNILEQMHRQYRERQPYISYLVATRQSLIISREQIQKSIAHLEQSISVCTKFFSMTRVRRFLDSRMSSVNEFVEGFIAIDLLDEKSEHLTQFMDRMYEEMAADPTWSDASPDELEESKTLMEKRFLCSVYQYVFFPHEMAAMTNKLFHSHIEENLQHISADHSAIEIREECRGEMPWPAAQKALLRMNAYKSPGDKLDCIVQCCSTLMDNLQLGGRSAGADDFFPLLVYVILKANPPNLQATIQFLNFFAGSAINSGEASYWFAQFQTAVTYVQSIDDRADAKAPSA